jgi:simple sugar transport system ATP-binding protein
MSEMFDTEITLGGMLLTNDIPLKAVNITKRFGAVWALRGVNLELRKGEILGLVGDNGAGKTTFLKIVAGIYQPTSGELYVFGRKVTFRSPRDAIRMGIYMVHQEQELSLIPVLSVKENFFLGRYSIKSYFGGLLKLIDWDYIENETKKFLNEFGYKFEINRPVETLSGGERQILAVLRAFSVRPRILLLDESTTALSERGRREVFSYLKDYISKTQASAIYVTHALDDALRVSDRIVLLKHGKIVYEFETKAGISKEDIMKHLWGEEE